MWIIGITSDGRMHLAIVGYSNRQNKYAQIARSGRIYTPHMIVNGTQAFVGSDQRQGTSAIQSALKQAAKANVVLESLKKPASNTWVFGG